MKMLMTNLINYISGIVYKYSFISRCLTSVNSKQNTSAMTQKTTPNNQKSISLSKPMPNKNAESYGQKTDTFKNTPVRNPKDNKATHLKKILNYWIDSEYRPSYFLSIRLPKHWESVNSFNSQSHLRMIMKVFEKRLLGRHWNKHHLPFIAFAENGIDIDYHYHLLLNQGAFTEQELRNAILETNITLGLASYCLYLEPIICNEGGVKFYSEKEIKVDSYYHFDSERFILSQDLFYLPYKNTSR